MNPRERMRRAGSGEDFIDLVLSEHAKEVEAKLRREIAAGIRKSKVANPLGEAEEHVNFVLDDLANGIERGRNGS